MKQLFFAACLLMVGLVTNAQADSTLQEYTGKFKFPEGGPFPEVAVTLEKGILSATAATGSSELKKTDTKDVFEVAAYGGLATFRRGDDGKIRTLRIQVQDVDVEGTKADSTGIAGYRELLRRQYDQ